MFSRMHLILSIFRPHARQGLLPLVLLAVSISQAYAQGSFSSGSTGADGPFNPTTNQTIQLPESGVFNFTTVNIPNNVTITFARNAKNTPVVILATGNVTIAGTINLNGANGSLHAGGIGGPGGSNGGAGGYAFSDPPSGSNADGPGGGGAGLFSITGIGAGGGGGYSVNGDNGGGPAQYLGTGGPRYGAYSLVPLIGGSGGGGGSGNGGLLGVLQHGGSGGGGGGAILIASSGSIAFTSGAISARGGAGALATTGCGSSCNQLATSGGGGSGGAIRLVANTITGNVTLNVSGGSGPQTCFGVVNPFCSAKAGNGAGGFIRIEAYDLANLNPQVTPTVSTSTSIAQPRPATLSNAPQLRIASVAGISAPANPSGSFAAVPDITVPTAQASPVVVALEAVNIPLNAVAQVSVTPERGGPTIVQSTPLAGTLVSSTANASVTLPTGVCLISAVVTVDLSLLSNAKPIFIDGERVRKMEISATFGAASEVTYLTESGRRIRQVK